MPDRFEIPPPSSGGLILSYQCSNQCRHCLYACSPAWKKWMSGEDIETILSGLKRHSRFLTGLHIAGGEPMLRPDLVEHAVSRAVALDLPLEYVETNAFWCWNDEGTLGAFSRLKEAGLKAVMVSVSPFHLEFVPMERVRRAVDAGRKVFGKDRVYLFTRYFFDQFEEIDPKHPIAFEDYVDAVGAERAAALFAAEYSLIPNGRAATRLQTLYERRRSSHYFGESCERELSSPHHMHVDPDGRYIAGLCAGISLGDARDADALFSGIELDSMPFLKRVVRGGVAGLYEWAVSEHGYEEKEDGYIAKCHVCLDIRRHLVNAGAAPAELGPAEFYENL